MSRNRFFFLHQHYKHFEILTYSHTFCDSHNSHIFKNFATFLNISIFINDVSRALANSLNFQSFNIKYRQNLIFVDIAINTRNLKESITTLNDRVKVFIIVIIVLHNSTTNDIELYAQIKDYLNELTRRLNVETIIKMKKTRMIERCFNLWERQITNFWTLLRLCKSEKRWEYWKKMNKKEINDCVTYFVWLLTYEIFRTCNWRRRALQWWNTIIKTQTCLREVDFYFLFSFL